MYYARHLESVVVESTKHYPVVMMTGPRQVGKTTLLKKLSEDRRFVTLDDPNIRTFATTQPELFFERYKPPILIDEIQYAPELFPYIKMIVDHQNQNGLFWLTGSQIFPLMQDVKESLAGRVRLLRLYGFSISEIIGTQPGAFPKDIQHYLSEPIEFDAFAHMIKGSFPRVIVEDGIHVGGFYSSYVQTYLERDVRAITDIDDMTTFLNFVRLVAVRTGCELNMATFAKEIAVDNTTIKRWLKILETSGLITYLRPYAGNLGKRIVKRPKLYFMDTGLACYLAGIDTVEALLKSPILGNLFETFVASEIMKSWWNLGREPRIYYYRDMRQKEIDIIVEARGQLYPFEIKTNQHTKKSIAAFKVLENSRQTVGFGGVIYSGKETVPIDDQNWAVPVSKL